MKILCLLRHAKAIPADAGMDDFDRPLSDRGKKEGPWTGKELKKFGFQPDVIISSPAKRALKTAQAVAKEIKYPPKKIVLEPEVFEASQEELVRMIKDIDDAHERAILSGHNPSITDVTNFLSSRDVGELPTSAVVILEFDIDSWEKVGPHKGKVILSTAPQMDKDKK